MADDKTKTRPQDSSRINVNEPYELQYWTEKLGVSEQRLRDAVQSVGVSVEKVRHHLKQ